MLTDGRQVDRTGAVLPTWRYWVLSVVLSPALAVAGVVLSVHTAVSWWLWAVAAVAVTAAAIGFERHVRTMSGVWRAVWVAIGVGLGALIGYGSMIVAFAVACPPGCLS